MNQDGEASYGEFIGFYRKHGLVPTPYESEAEVAIFGFSSTTGKISIKHGARREELTGFWLSKMGQGGILRHDRLDVFEDSPYGDLILMFKRI